MLEYFSVSVFYMVVDRDCGIVCANNVEDVLAGNAIL